MSQAPSVAFAADSEDNLAGAAANPSGKSPNGSRVPSREAESDREAGAVTEGDRHKENVSLRGTTRGFEILISGAPSTAALGTRLTELFAEAPSFFAGSSARVAIDGALPSGGLGCLEQVAAQFEVQIVEIGPVAPKRRRLDIPAVLRPEDVPLVHLAEGTGPIAEEPVGLSCERGAASAVLPALPAHLAPSDAVPASTIAPPDAAPTEIALANTAPMNVASVAVTPVTAPSVTAASSDAAPVSAAPVNVATGAVAPSVTGSTVAVSSAAAPSVAAPVSAASTHTTPAVAQLDAFASAAAEITSEHAGAEPPGPRLVIGPVRSGVIVDHPGHVIVIGDVNPGAEVRAEGSILVLGRLRGVAHAAIGRQAGCIIALSLQPQQLRIGRMVARAADADRPGDGAEIAYATGETIVVERFLGRLPSGLAASM